MCRVYRVWGVGLGCVVCGVVWCGVTRVHEVAALGKARIEGLVRVRVRVRGRG